jgi:hypothetical protein
MHKQGAGPGVVARRVGYAIAVLVNLVVLYLFNVQPGWRSASFLTDDTPQVLVLLNLSLVAGIVANVVYILIDGPWVKAIGDLTTTTISLAVLIRLWQVFPFDFTAWTVNWGLIIRAVVAVALAGTVIGLVVQTLALARLSTGRSGHRGSGTHALR